MGLVERDYDIVLDNKNESCDESENLHTLVTAGDFIMNGIKPLPYAVMDSVKRDIVTHYKYSQNGVYDDYSIVIAGDSVSDLMLGDNIKKELKKSDYCRKVRLIKVFVNRYGNDNNSADYCVNNLENLASICKSENCNLLISDWDNTLAKCYLKKSVNAKSGKKSFMNRFGKILPVRIGFGLFTLYNLFIHFAGVRTRKLYTRSEDNLKNFFERLRENDTKVIINSLCTRSTIKSLIRKAGCEEYFQN